MVNVRGQLLYPVLGSSAQAPAIQFPPHRPGPLTNKTIKDRERALELLKQVSVACFSSLLTQITVKDQNESLL